MGELYFLFVCWFCIRLSCWVVACEYGPDILFVHQGDVFLGLVECCVGEYSEDFEAGFRICVYVYGLLVERFFFFLSYVIPSEECVSV